MVKIHAIDSIIEDTEQNLMQFKQVTDLTATGKLSTYLIPPHLMTDLTKMLLQLP
jgi:hypothetical protein